MITKNVPLLPPLKASAWRKISLGTWRPNGDSQVYVELRHDAGPILRKLEQLNARGEDKITLTHVMGLMIGRILSEIPDLNSVVRWGKVYPRQNVDIFFHVSYHETELSGHVIRNIHQKTLSEISRELSSKASMIKTGQDVSFGKIRRSWDFIPGLLARPVVSLLGFLSYQLNLNIKGLGVPKDCFGSMMITNIGSLGFHSAFVPIPPYTHVPLMLALGRPELRPVCLPDGSIVAQQQLSLCFTFDHRIMDGARGARMAKRLEELMQNPDLLEKS
jgi:pyruvate/2-oxoglutarate dehydrogenase complex dihydrolipoamide acyltransferase (E2) component